MFNTIFDYRRLTLEKQGNQLSFYCAKLLKRPEKVFRRFT
jgi:hypothetical protein